MRQSNNIDHGNGIISTYSHLNETFVSEGDNVLKNSKIATVGSGRVTGPHLHFEIILLGTKVNPMYFFKDNSLIISSSVCSPTNVCSNSPFLLTINVTGRLSGMIHS